MTLLAGTWLWARSDDPERSCRAILKAMGCESGTIRTIADGCAFGLQLFSSLPEDVYDRQPLNASSIALVADLRLDNRAELAASLGLGSDEAALLADSDILHLCWRRWKAGCLARLIGDFAIVAWDGDEKCLYLARDFGGQRPLHYTTDGSGVSFGSLPSGLCPSTKARPKLDAEAWASYLVGLPQTGSSTMFAGIRRVEPGTVVAFRQGRSPSIERYWRPRVDPIDMNASDAVDATRELLDAAVKARLRSRSPIIAAQLSSGLDSSAVATSAALQEARPLLALTGEPASGEWVDTPGRHGDEGGRAAELAALYTNMEHARVRVPTRPVFDSMEEWNSRLDQPVRNYANMHWLGETYRSAATRGATVMLIGVYGNFSISYEGRPRFSEMFRRGQWRDWNRNSRKYREFTGARLRGVLAMTLGGSMPEPVWQGVERMRGNPRRDLVTNSFLDPDHRATAHISLLARSLYPPMDGRPGTDSLAERMSGLDSVDNALLHHAFLRRWRVETRDPTHDRRLVEFLLRLPTRVFFDDGRHRSLARELLRGRAPASIVEAPTRGTQGGDFRQSIALSEAQLFSEIDAIASTPGLNDLLDVARLRRSLENCLAGNWEGWGVLIRTVGLAHFARTRFDVVA